MKYQKGDTIVEVLVAFAVFALLAAGTFAVMGRGVSTAQESLEVTLVRQQIDAQAELLRHVRNSEAPAWVGTPSAKGIIDSDNLSPQAPSITDCTISTSARPFVLVRESVGSTTLARRDIKSGGYGEPELFSRIDYDAVFAAATSPKPEGIWVEAVEAQNNATGVRAYDFYIRACWYGPDSKQETLSTVVRLYEN